MEDVKQIVATDFTTAILEGESVIHCFGIPTLKPRCLLNNKLSLLPDWVTIAENLNVVDISVGQRHALLLTAEGEVYGLGSNEYGLLGLGDITICGARLFMHYKARVRANIYCYSKARGTVTLS
ncbi:RCC1 repeats protein [Candidatus Rickettsiella viridis]|uniref:RCC1 repeats protein n=1 Tax=Candidatus Rickettsiella viridis TaxID=676208 RepID=A0A2Z5UVX5_9COXI|nr:RCC1 domain-containing protein [Candidatus Rickettsiella viridis]BBB15215.1 RCC1 repeats protein [Candidatus Rickettsiella viridis]